MSYKFYKFHRSYKPKVVVALSGGVDSSVAALLLRKAGYDVVGMMLKLWHDPQCSVQSENICCDDQAVRDARELCAKLKIPFYLINAEKEFRWSVVEDFLTEFAHGRTPNPCVLCNRAIKFDLLWKKARSIGADFLATGHYARILSCHSERSEESSHSVLLCHSDRPQGAEESLSPVISSVGTEKSRKNLGKGSLGFARDDKLGLCRAVDSTKDQSYMLWQLTPEDLKHTIFPLGELTKKEVREIAKKHNLPTSEKKESQEICFVGDNYREFLKRYLPPKALSPGKIIDQNENVLGFHNGLPFYTEGQRVAISSPKAPDFIPHYVTKKDLAENILYVAPGKNKALFSKEMTVEKINWLRKPEKGKKLLVQIRYHHDAVPCQIKLVTHNASRITFKTPQRAVTPGQSAVFYVGDELVGGGIIR